MFKTMCNQVGGGTRKAEFTVPLYLFCVTVRSRVFLVALSINFCSCPPEGNIF